MDHVIESLRDHLRAHESRLTGDRAVDTHAIDDCRAIRKAIRELERHYYGEPRTPLELSTFEWISSE